MRDFLTTVIAATPFNTPAISRLTNRLSAQKASFNNPAIRHNAPAIFRNANNTCFQIRTPHIYSPIKDATKSINPMRHPKNEN